MGMLLSFRPLRRAAWQSPPLRTLALLGTGASMCCRLAFMLELLDVLCKNFVKLLLLNSLPCVCSADDTPGLGGGGRV